MVIPYHHTLLSQYSKETPLGPIWCPRPRGYHSPWVHLSKQLYRVSTRETVPVGIGVSFTGNDWPTFSTTGLPLGTAQSPSGLCLRHQETPRSSRTPRLRKTYLHQLRLRKLPIPSPFLWALHSPHSLYKLLTTVVAHLCQRSIAIFPYLDDWLPKGQSALQVHSVSNLQDSSPISVSGLLHQSKEVYIRHSVQSSLDNTT